MMHLLGWDRHQTPEISNHLVRCEVFFKNEVPYQGKILTNDIEIVLKEQRLDYAYCLHYVTLECILKP